MTGAVFVSSETVAGRLARGDALRLLEVRRDAEAAFDQHLPGAVVAVLAEHLSRTDAPTAAGKRPLPEPAALQDTLQRWGLDTDTATVVYDHDGSFVAARAWWVLRWAGLTDVTILDGGLPAWVAAGHPVGDLATAVPAGSITVTSGHLPELHAEDAAALATQGRLLDARGAEAFTAGHIPGARNAASADTVDAHGVLRGPDALLAHYGLDGGAPVPGLYCGGGVAAAHGVAVLAHLGIEAPLYVGSFSAWSADPDRPVEIGGARDGVRS